MSDRQHAAPGAVQHDAVSAKPADSDGAMTVRWNQIVEWTDEDQARWREAHRPPAHPQY
jgi:hypothetical protein